MDSARLLTPLGDLATMESDELIRLAESCSQLRASIGRMLLTGQTNPDDLERAQQVYRRSLRKMLEHARRADCATFLEVAGEVGV